MLLHHLIEGEKGWSVIPTLSISNSVALFVLTRFITFFFLEMTAPLKNAIEICTIELTDLEKENRNKNGNF